MKIAVVYTATTPELTAGIKEELENCLAGEKAEIVSYQNPAILQEAKESGGATANCARELVDLFEQARRDGADVILNACSSVGAAAKAAKPLYMALQQGTYDAQENPIPVIHNNKLFEAQKFLSITNHIYSGMCFTVADSVWQQLSDAQKTIVADAAKASSAFNRQLNKKMAEDFIGTLGTTGGMTIINPELEPFKKATEAVYETTKDVYGDALLKRLADWKAAR